MGLISYVITNVCRMTGQHDFAFKDFFEFDCMNATNIGLFHTAYARSYKHYPVSLGGNH